MEVAFRRGTAKMQKGNTYPGEQRVKTMDFLPFGYISIILSNALQCKLLHQVDLIRFLQVCSLKKSEGRS